MSIYLLIFVFYLFFLFISLFSLEYFNLMFILLFLFISVDPRRWSREDVTRWLQWTSEMFHLGSINPERFQMNGKALCLMTMDMFLYRVPEGGNILYQDFQRRLRNAVALQN